VSIHKGILSLVLLGFALPSNIYTVQPTLAANHSASEQTVETGKPKKQTRWTTGRKIMAGIGLVVASLYTVFLGLEKKRALEISWANQLASAIKAGNLMKVKELIEVEGFNPENRSETNATAIIVAAQARQPSIAVYLVKDRRVNINAEDKKELTALDHAIINGDKPMVRTLIGIGAPVNKQDPHERSYLEEAVLRDQPEIVTILLENGAKPNWHAKTTSPLLYAADHDRVDMVRQLLKYGAKDDTKSYPFEETAYDKAKNNGNLELMQLLDRVK
jgi:ankyrin repeat protein